MRMMRIAVLAASAGMLAAACGGGSSSTPTQPTPATGGTTTSTVTTINIVGVNGKLSFSPNPASIPAGQQAVFKNNDSVTHHIVIDSMSIDTGDIAPGATSKALALGGVNASYHCSLHPSMVGSLNTAETPEPPPCTGYCG